MAYEYEIMCRDVYSFLKVVVPESETLKVEASAMASMDTNLKMQTKLKGGFRRFLTKESLFINEFQAQNGAGEIFLAPGPSGDISYIAMDGRQKFYLTSGCYLASCMGVELNTKWQGVSKGIFTGSGFFIIECGGKGDLWFNTYGAIFEIDVKDEYVVDNGHLVGFTEGLEYQITKLGGYKSLFLSGEGFVCRFRGEGKVYIQTKNPFAFVGWADRFRKVFRRSN